MPKLWSATIEEHRSAVFDAILDATGHLIHRQGVTGLTMTSIAEAAGVGLPTQPKPHPSASRRLPLPRGDSERFSNQAYTAQTVRLGEVPSQE